MRKIIDLVGEVQQTLGTVLLIALLITVFLEVVSRYIIHAPIPWTEEGSRYLFFWVVLMAASVSLQKKRHFVIEVFDPKNVRNSVLRFILGVLPEVIVFLYTLFLTYYGYLYFKATAREMGIDVPISMSVVEAAIPVMGITMALYSFVNMIVTIGEYAAPVAKTTTEGRQ